MKFNIIPSLIAIAIGVLLGYGVFSVADKDPNADLAFGVSAVSFCITLIFGIGMSYGDKRKGVSLKTLSIVAVIVMAISQFVFAAVGIHKSSYIIVNCLLFVIFLGIFYGIYKSVQN